MIVPRLPSLATSVKRLGQRHAASSVSFAVSAFAPGDQPLVMAIEGVRCGFLICLDWAFPELWAEHAGEVELVFHSCVSDETGRDRNAAHTIPPLMQGYAWLHQYAISVSNSCRPSQHFPSFWVERSGHAGLRAQPDVAGLVVNALADDPEQDRFFGMVQEFRRSATDGSLYAPHRIKTNGVARLPTDFVEKGLLEFLLKGVTARVD